MRFEGVLSAWDPNTGHGAIRPSGGGEEVFVGLAAFPTDGEGARLDERLSFEIVTGRDGRKQAVQLRRLSRGHVSPTAMREATGGARFRARQAQRKRRLGLVAGGAVVTVMLVLGGVRWWHPAVTHDVPPAMRR
ncbi:hypothetical protein [Roseateles sp.]|uniref:hypothetical protein n=1 Tax=Roseateles sp. TaxID=1971397 RepID=UPI0039E9DEF4